MARESRSWWAEELAGMPRESWSWGAVEEVDLEGFGGAGGSEVMDGWYEEKEARAERRTRRPRVVSASSSRPSPSAFAGQPSGQ